MSAAIALSAVKFGNDASIEFSYTLSNINISNIVDAVLVVNDVSTASADHSDSDIKHIRTTVVAATGSVIADNLMTDVPYSAMFIVYMVDGTYTSSPTLRNLVPILRYRPDAPTITGARSIMSTAVLTVQLQRTEDSTIIMPLVTKLYVTVDEREGAGIAADMHTFTYTLPDGVDLDGPIEVPLTGLEVNHEYEVSIVAVNTVGVSYPSNTIVIIPPNKLPAPANVTLTVGDKDALRISWDHNAMDEGGVPWVNKYVIEVSRPDSTMLDDEDDEVIIPGTILHDTTIEVTSSFTPVYIYTGVPILNGTTVRVRIRALSPETLVSSDYSDYVTAIICSRMSKPTIGTITYDTVTDVYRIPFTGVNYSGMDIISFNLSSAMGAGVILTNIPFTVTGSSYSGTVLLSNTLNQAAAFLENTYELIATTENANIDPSVITRPFTTSSFSGIIIVKTLPRFNSSIILTEQPLSNIRTTSVFSHDVPGSIRMTGLAVVTITSSHSNLTATNADSNLTFHVPDGQPDTTWDSVKFTISYTRDGYTVISPVYTAPTFNTSGVLNIPTDFAYIAASVTNNDTRLGATWVAPVTNMFELVYELLLINVNLNVAGTSATISATTHTFTSLIAHNMYNIRIVAKAKIGTTWYYSDLVTLSTVRIVKRPSMTGPINVIQEHDELLSISWPAGTPYVDGYMVTDGSRVVDIQGLADESVKLRDDAGTVSVYAYVYEYDGSKLLSTIPSSYNYTILNTPPQIIPTIDNLDTWVHIAFTPESPSPIGGTDAYKIYISYVDDSNTAVTLEYSSADYSADITGLTNGKSYSISIWTVHADRASLQSTPINHIIRPHGFPKFKNLPPVNNADAKTLTITVNPNGSTLSNYIALFQGGNTATKFRISSHDFNNDIVPTNVSTDQSIVINYGTAGINTLGSYIITVANRYGSSHINSFDLSVV